MHAHSHYLSHALCLSFSLSLSQCFDHASFLSIMHTDSHKHSIHWHKCTEARTLNLSFFLFVALPLCSFCIRARDQSHTRFLSLRLSLSLSHSVYPSYSPASSFTPHPRAHFRARSVSLHTNNHAHTHTPTHTHLLFPSLSIPQSVLAYTYSHAYYSRTLRACPVAGCLVCCYCCCCYTC